MMLLRVRHSQSSFLTVGILGCVVNIEINFHVLVAWLLMLSGKRVGQNSQSPKCSHELVCGLHAVMSVGIDLLEPMCAEPWPQ